MTDLAKGGGVSRVRVPIGVAEAAPGKVARVVRSGLVPRACRTALMAAAIAIAAPGTTRADPRLPPVTTTLWVLQGHVSMTPIDPQTGQPLDNRLIVVETGHLSVLALGAAPLVAVISAAERARLAAEFGQLPGLAPGAAATGRPSQGGVAGNAKGSADHSGKRHDRHDHHNGERHDHGDKPGGDKHDHDDKHDK